MENIIYFIAGCAIGFIVAILIAAKIHSNYKKEFNQEYRKLMTHILRASNSVLNLSVHRSAISVYLKCVYNGDEKCPKI